MTFRGQVGNFSAPPCKKSAISVYKKQSIFIRTKNKTVLPIINKHGRLKKNEKNQKMNFQRNLPFSYQNKMWKNNECHKNSEENRNKNEFKILF